MVPSYSTHPTGSSGDKQYLSPHVHTDAHTCTLTHFPLLKWFTERHPVDHISPNEKLCQSRSVTDDTSSVPVFFVCAIRLPFCRMGLLLRKTVNYISSTDQSSCLFVYLVLLPHSFTLLRFGVLAWVIDHSLPKVVPTWSRILGSTGATHFSYLC